MCWGVILLEYEICTMRRMERNKRIIGNHNTVRITVDGPNNTFNVDDSFTSDSQPNHDTFLLMIFYRIMYRIQFLFQSDPEIVVTIRSIKLKFLFVREDHRIELHLFSQTFAYKLYSFNERAKVRGLTS
ncbi:MAG: hypothetical protein EZS28_024669 [Streblomastix strix]|uniref:Uncharacterized protein n=1 Tax=Streblomastix strix TaxID=222440 RepID=A0A5J4VBE9_9EUKA|nr:MAG: hypothetical protein EZS28_024669 [Streblomastix strix]